MGNFTGTMYNDERRLSSKSRKAIRLAYSETKPLPSKEPSLCNPALSLVIVLPPGMSRLTTVVPSAHLLLVTAHAGTQRDIHTGWCREAEASGHFDQVELINVENGAERMRGIRLKVGFVSFLRGLEEELA
jgi:hypothetical protein